MQRRVMGELQDGRLNRTKRKAPHNFLGAGDIEFGSRTIHGFDRNEPFARSPSYDLKSHRRSRD